MANQLKADKSVSTMQRRLHQAMDHKDIKKDDPLVSTFQDIDTKLKDLKRDTLLFQRWEDNLVAKFNSLEHQVHEIFSTFKANRATDTAVINAKLKDVGGEIQKLSKYLQGPAPQETHLDLPEEKYRYVDENPYRRVPEKWLELRVEEQILNSSALENLQASYFCLDSATLRLGLLSLSIFPENAVIKRRPLIYWWISEGFVKADEHGGSRPKKKEEVQLDASKKGKMEGSDIFETAEEAGEHAFQRLLDLGLIKPYHDNPEKPGPRVNACTVHPWMRYMLISLARNSEFLEFDWQGTPLSISESGRGCLVSSNQAIRDTVIKEDVLSVFNVSEKYIKFDPAGFEKLKKVEILQLGRWQKSPSYHIEVVDETFLNGLGALKHLKYLSLRGISRITTLPSSVVKLFNLEILDLKACHNLETLPSDIESLKKLTHLDVSDCPLLDRMPKGLEKLLNLQVLKGFLIGSRTRAYRIPDLAKLKKLRRLSVHIVHEADVKERELLGELHGERLTELVGELHRELLPLPLQNLKHIDSLRCLKVSWGVKSPAPAYITKMSFPQKLEKLSLIGIPSLEEPTKKLKKEAMEVPADPMEQHSTEPTMEAEEALDPNDPSSTDLETKAKEAATTPRPLLRVLTRIHSGLMGKPKEALADTKDKDPPSRPLEDLKPSNLQQLKRLYIRGGELGGLDHEDGFKWGVEVLILKYLKNLNIQTDKLLKDFPRLTYLAVKCEEKEQDFVWTEREIRKKRSDAEGTSKEENKEDVVSKETRKLKGKEKLEEEDENKEYAEGTSKEEFKEDVVSKETRKLKGKGKLEEEDEYKEYAPPKHEIEEE